ncbi:MAG TPA: ATP-binding protein [Candidatus Hydrogenedentes bacterium]|nr:ATP-binding protein [Candidatus Hydrogenedentota bacterium]HRZ81787.1 ATP-binding protein [Candidatus Hydrogenedentota bacterium]
MDGTVRVLVVDADADLRRLAAESLRGRAVPLPGGGDAVLEVEEASSSCRCCARIAAFSPDILVLDAELTCAAGADLMAQAREGRSELAVIMTESFPTYAAAVEVARRGAVDFLPKPFTPGQLLEAVARALRFLEETRRERLHALEKRRIRFEFVSVLAHELKAPLAAAESALQILDAGTLGAALPPYAPLVERALARLEAARRLVGDLLDLTRVESGERPRALEFLDLARLARAVLEEAGPAARGRGVALSLDAPEPFMVRADRWEVESILQNLVSNAVKYNRDGGAASLRLWQDTDHVFIEARDTGIGMTPAETAGLFHEFGRVRKRETERIPGTGLGLALVRKLAALYDGGVAVESVPGEGSVFTVRLRRCRGAGLED